MVAARQRRGFTQRRKRPRGETTVEYRVPQESEAVTAERARVTREFIQFGRERRAGVSRRGTI